MKLTRVENLWHNNHKDKLSKRMKKIVSHHCFLSLMGVPDKPQQLYAETTKSIYLADLYLKDSLYGLVIRLSLSLFLTGKKMYLMNGQNLIKFLFLTSSGNESSVFVLKAFCCFVQVLKSVQVLHLTSGLCWF